jgi:hypothetical protein
MHYTQKELRKKKRIVITEAHHLKNSLFSNGICTIRTNSPQQMRKKNKLYIKISTSSTTTSPQLRRKKRR